MYKYTIHVQLEGKIYQTNVSANKDQTEEVFQIAREQVLSQWVK
jgi:hypothetical protein